VWRSITRTHRYQITGTGLRHALFLTRLHAASCAQDSPTSPDSPHPSPPHCAPPTAYRDALDELARQAGLAA
jgi:hypothetical protein